MLPTQTIEKDLAELKIIQEMLSTETNYNDSLALLEMAFAKDELVNTNPVLLQFKVIIPLLKIISDKLLANVTKGVNEALSPEERLGLKAERTQLMKAFFHAYQKYPNLYDAYLIENRTNPSALKALEAFIIQSTAKKFGLADLLSQPFQRGMRYEMLVKGALTYSDDLSPQHVHELKELLVFIADSIKTANSAMPEVKKAEPTSYRIGDYSRNFLFGSSNEGTVNRAPVNTSPKEEKKEGYRVGDLTRSAINYWYSKPEAANVTQITASDLPPTDLPPQLPSNPEVNNNEPPTDLPPQLPEDFQQDPENPDNTSFTL